MNEIENNNRLIAEFMDATLVDWVDVPTYDIKELCAIYKPEEMKYRTSWDWLMPPCKKAFEICYNHKGKIDNSILELNILETAIRIAIGTYDIEKTVKALTQFIKWYNTTKN